MLDEAMMKGMLIYLVRHGITAANKRSIYIGWADEVLDEEGISQVRALGVTLKGEGISAIYSSPVKRALQTSEILGEYLSTPIVTEQGLGEIRFGKWEGLSASEIRKRYPDEYQLWKTRPADLVDPGRESLTTFQKRCIDSIWKIANLHQETKVLAVTHLANIRALILYFKNQDLNLYPTIKIQNASYIRLEYDGIGFKVLDDIP